MKTLLFGDAKRDQESGLSGNRKKLSLIRDHSSGEYRPEKDKASDRTENKSCDTMDSNDDKKTKQDKVLSDDPGQENASLHSPLSHETHENSESAGGKPKILLVDDNYDFYQIVKISYEDDLDIDYAQDGFTAFQLVRRNQYDLVLCDILMPMLNGLALLNEFKKKHISIPFLFVTGNANDKIIKEAFHAGAYNLIEKPFDKRDLLEKVHLAIKLNKSEKPTEINDQDKAYIYNTLKTYYYDVDKILRLIKSSNIPVSVIHQELDKKIRTGKCSFDDISNIKHFRSVS